MTGLEVLRFGNYELIYAFNTCMRACFCHRIKQIQKTLISRFKCEFICHSEGGESELWGKKSQLLLFLFVQWQKQALIKHEPEGLNLLKCFDCTLRHSNP